ncbi:hypothetical protein WJX72_010030 [[Myrmecia] bisecta]|uniref:Brix domain-containing protein n=1 Tax=[Myrmecia] bisecta TaxID=41462 RepID=A0AAW1PH44_9CHLO
MARTRRRKVRTHVPQYVDPAKKGDPKSFVFWRGKHGLILKALEADMRKVMTPNTATHLKESKRNVLKDFVNIAGPLGVSHFVILTATENACYLRVAKTPRGPTLTMKIHEYSLMRDVVASQQRPRMPESMWKVAPLVVMNNFASGGEEHLKMATVLFQNLFPPINVRTVKLGACQRVVLLNYDKDTKRISFRHYNIVAQPSGVSKSVKALVGRKNLPDMSNMRDISEFLTKSGYGSESEGEEAEASRVTLAHDMGKGNLASRQSRIKLQEIGPRMELEIVKVEEGMCAGQVLYHSYIQKTAAEKAQLTQQQQEKDSADQLKKERRKEQEENVRKKEAAKRAAAAPAAGQQAKRRKMWWDQELEHANDHSDDDDTKYYKEEVGEEPDEDYALGTKSTSSWGRGASRGRFGGRGSSRGRFGGRGGASRGRGDRGGRGSGRPDRGSSRGSSRGGGRGHGGFGGRGGGRSDHGSDRGGRGSGRFGGKSRGGAFAMAYVLRSSTLTASSAVVKCHAAPKTVTQARAIRAPVARSLSSVQQQGSAFTIARQQASRRAVTFKVSASSDADIDLKEGVTGRGDYTHVLALVGLVGVFYANYSVDAELLLKSLAGLQLFTAASHLITQRGVFDHVTQVVGPSVLAAAVLNLRNISYLDVATGVFGYSLAEKLEGPTYVWLATLAAALYFGYGTQWYVAAFGVLAATRIYRNLNNSDGKRIPILLAPVVAASGYLLYKERTVTFALVLYLSNIAWSAWTTVEALIKTADS